MAAPAPVLQLHEIVRYYRNVLLLEFPHICLLQSKNPTETYIREATPDNNIVQSLTLKFTSFGSRNGVSLYDCKPGSIPPFAEYPVLWSFRVRFLVKRLGGARISLEYDEISKKPKKVKQHSTDPPLRDGQPVNDDEFLKYINLLKMYFFRPELQDKLFLLINAINQEVQSVTRDFTLDNRPRDVETFEPVKFSTDTDQTVYMMVNNIHFYRLDYLASWYYTRLTSYYWQPIPDPQSNLPITSIQKVIIKPLVQLNARESTMREREMQMTRLGLSRIEGIKRRRSLGGGRRK